MKNPQANNRFDFSFDEDGARQVSEQIMDSYNSGVIDQEKYEKSLNTKNEVS